MRRRRPLLLLLPPIFFCDQPSLRTERQRIVPPVSRMTMQHVYGDHASRVGGYGIPPQGQSDGRTAKDHPHGGIQTEYLLEERVEIFQAFDRFEAQGFLVLLLVVVVLVVVLLLPVDDVDASNFVVHLLLHVRMLAQRVQRPIAPGRRRLVSRQYERIAFGPQLFVVEAVPTADVALLGVEEQLQERFPLQFRTSSSRRGRGRGGGRGRFRYVRRRRRRR
mmetsp:Transcript_54582/g.163087  ORF Transcript_54582/g.163087 Transcript_54582/m.163087 type:complete len:220 (+) Transcript_54582:301-960(+)